MLHDTKLGHDALCKAADDHKIRLGKGGEAIHGYGIALLFNKGGRRKNQRIDISEKE